MKKKMIAAMLAAMCLCSTVTANVYAEENVKDLAVFEEGEQMTLDDVIELSKKGNALTWGDFVKYKGVDVGSGLYILEYVLENGYILHVGGVPPTAAIAEAKIEYIRLSHGKKSIDIRTDDVEAFIAEIKSENDSTALRGTKTMTIDAVRELAKNGNALDWSDFAEYKGRDIGSGIYIWEFELEDGLKLDVSGLVDRKPDRIWLYRSDIKNGIDIREDSVDDFLHITAYAVMTVTVTDVSGDVMLVTSSGKSGDLFTLSRKYLDDDIEPVVGMKLEVTFSGGILETYPAQFGGVKKVTVVSDDAKQIKGDANCDGGVDMADVVFIMQSLANPDKYQLTETGRINADMDGNGVTVADARTIQMLLLGYDINEILGVDSSAVAKKKFVYEKEGFGGDCIIEFKEDGTFLYSPGYLSSYLGGGTWKISGNKVILTQENDGMEGKRVNYFSIVGNDLIYIEEGSDNFIGTNVKDGEKFYVAYENSGKNELKASDIISIKTPYSPAMSDWSGIGILLEVDSPDYPIFLRAADGHFTEWDIKTGSGPIKNVGNEYDAGKNGYIFWTPDEMYYKDGFNTEIIVAGVSGDVFIDFGRIYITQVEGGKFVASFEKPKKSVEPPTCAEDAGIATEGGKRVSFGLYAALRQYENTNAQIAVTPKYGTDRNYVYNGKTIQQYHNEWDEESCLGEKYGQLLKEGDKLKYGEALYTTGTPDGEKWDKDWYDTRVRFYGENFLAKYIVNGEFLRDKVLADQEEYFNGNTINYTYNMLHEAIDAYTAEMIQATIPQLEALNIRYEYREAQKELVFYVTVAEFEALSLENVSSYGLATDTMSAIAEDMGMIVYTHDD